MRINTLVNTGFRLGFRHQVPASGARLPSSGADRVDHAGRGADFGAELREFNGQAEHVYVLVSFPATVAIFRLVNSLKGACPPPPLSPPV
jgi:hypothetical protein